MTPDPLRLAALAVTGALVAAALGTLAGGVPPRGHTDGQPYTIRRLAKADVQWRRIGHDQVRVAPYFQYQLEREDERYLYVREYRVPATSARPPRSSPSPAPSAADANAELASVDRVQLQPFSTGLPTAGQWRHQLALADLNGDGHLDLVHGPPRKGVRRPHIFLGDGAGHWFPWAAAVFPPGAYDYGGVAVADFDGDGHLDLVLAAHLQGLTVLLGDGQGTFRDAATPATFAAGAPQRFSSRVVAARDWNRDGRPDLITLGEGPSRGGGGSLGWVIYLNDGNGGWECRAQPAPATFGNSLAVADFDGDGWDDLATASQALGRRDILHYGGAGDPRTVRLDVLPAQALVYAVAAGDLDEDGRADLVAGSLVADGGQWHSALDVFLSRPNDRWEPVVLRRHPGRRVIHAVATGDIDGDGHADVAAADDQGAVRLYLGDGHGGFAAEQAPELTPLGDGCRGYALVLRDLTGDGRDEIVAGFASETSPLAAEPGCPNGGSLQVWSPVPAR